MRRWKKKDMMKYSVWNFMGWLFLINVEMARHFHIAFLV